MRGQKFRLTPVSNQHSQQTSGSYTSSSQC